MKTPTLRLALLAGAFASSALALSAAPSATPARDDCCASDSGCAAAPRNPVASAPAAAPTTVCTDARAVTRTETKILSTAGRAATRTIVTTVGLVCRACDTPMIALKPSGHNGRGAMAPVAIYGTHDCTRGCSR